MFLRTITTIALLGISGAALAADEPRKINFQTEMTDQDGNVMTDCADNPPPKQGDACKAIRPVTLGMLALRALSVQEQNLPQEENLKRGQLALSVYKSEGAQLTAEEIALIKKQISKFFGPIMVVRAFAMLDPAAK